MKKLIVLLVALMSFGCFTASNAVAKEKGKFQVAWSHYVGWEPWELANHEGILAKWAEKYGIEIKLELINDYIESINLYTAGSYDACVMTNMDALTIPAVGGIDSTAMIIGDFSNGNDAIVAKNANSMQDLKGRELMLVQFSVSHYALTRALEMNAMTEKDVKLVNVSDAEIAALFISNPNGAVVTWNPPLLQCRNARGAKLLFDSSQIPGEIIDMLVIRTSAPESLKKALAGAWYETMALMSSHSVEGKHAVKYMAEFSGCTEAEFRAQLRTTKMFYKAEKAAKFARGEEVKGFTKGGQLKETMEYVRTFSFDNGLFGEGAPDKNFVGIEFPDGSVLGDSGNVKLRFTDKYMQMAADGSL